MRRFFEDDRYSDPFSEGKLFCLASVHTAPSVPLVRTSATRNSGSFLLPTNLVAGYFCTVDFYPAGTEEQQKTEHIAEGTGQIPSASIDGK